MTTTLSNLIHEQHNRIYVDRARQWMRRNWRRYYEADALDTEALAEQAVYEYGIGLEEATRLAEEMAKEVR